MRKPCQLLTMVFPLALLMVGFLTVACEAGSQQPVDQNELRDLVREEVRFQFETLDVNTLLDLGSLEANLELALMEPLVNLQFEVEHLRSRVDGLGVEYAPRLEFENLRLDLEEVRGDMGRLDFEFVRRENLEDLRSEVQDLRNSPGAEGIEIELRSEISRIRFEVEDLMANFERTGSQFYADLDQMRFEVEDIRNQIESLQLEFGFQLDSLRLRVDALR